MAGDSLTGHGRSVDVVVVGSANLDIIVRTPRAPVPGETIIASQYGEYPGGKGLNQAVASAAHATTVFVARVGDDASGHTLRTYAASRGVNVDAVEFTAEAPTGRALITLRPDGENTIVVAPLANMTLTPAGARAALERTEAKVALVQFEIPAETVEAVAEWAAQTDTRLVVNPSPIRSIAPDLLALADPLLVNGVEAIATLEALGARSVAADPYTLARELSERCRSVVVTAGPEGACAAIAGQVTEILAPPVEVQDSSGAGDAFAGALCAWLSRGRNLELATRKAVAEGARVVGIPRSSR